MTFIGIMIILLWMICGAIGFGLCLGFFQGQWPQFAWKTRYSNVALSVFISFLGPFGMVCAYYMSDSGTHGLHYRVITKDESWAAHQARYPELDYAYFLRTRV